MCCAGIVIVHKDARRHLAVESRSARHTGIIGFAAWWIRRTYYLLQMPRWDRRLRIVLDWTVGLFFRSDITMLGLQVERELEQHGVRARGAAQLAAGSWIHEN
jgi:hypothetical protein